MVVTKPFSGGSPAGKGQPEAGPDRGEESPPPGAGRGHRKQLMVTMAGKRVNTLQCQFVLNTLRISATFSRKVQIVFRTIKNF